MPSSDADLPRQLARAEALVAFAATDAPADALPAQAVELLVTVGGAGGAAVYEVTQGRLALCAQAGYAMPASLPIPCNWQAVTSSWTHVTDEGQVEVALLRDGVPIGLVAMTSPRGPVPDDLAFQRRVADLLGTAMARQARIERLAAREQHLVAAQRISHVGSYDFEIATNTNDWSDQLYRIYGRQPGSFNASYEKFLELVHPDDREHIIAVHQEALANLAPYQMEERIVWPDGQVRTLASWGEVVPDATGRPARMVGICWDITEEKATAEALQRSSERFEALLDTAPSVVLVVSQTGTVLQANRRLEPVLGWQAADLLGRDVTAVLPGGVVDGRTSALKWDGGELPVEVFSRPVGSEEGPVTAVFLRDRTDAQRAEELALRLHDDDVRRRHALEINDNVVQGLASVLYLLDLGRPSPARAAAQQTLESAQGMMSDLLTGGGSLPLQPGDLVREYGHVGSLQEVLPPTPPAPAGALRVLLADDAEDIRLLLRFTLTPQDGFDVVGEARNGLEAVQLAEALRPDVVVLDLSMPVMDGLQAIPELLRGSPDLRVVVLSGFDEDRMKRVALDLGAHAYVEKGSATTELVAALDGLFPDRLVPQAAPVDDPDAGLPFDGDMLVHELRTPLTVITGMLSTLSERMDVLPSVTTAELLQAATRNARQMADLLDVVSDARRAERGLLPVVPEPTDIGELVRTCVADLCGAHGWVPAHVTAPAGVLADVDPMRIRQVLSNLLSNAYRFSPAGRPVRVEVSAEGPSLTVSVTDEGPGVPEQRRPELFTKFGRLENQGPGMGLGLYISRAIARAHGGELSLGPDGRTFVLSLPVKVPAT